MRNRDFMGRGARSMVLGALMVAALGVEASTEISPEKLKAIYNANVRREITDADLFGSCEALQELAAPALPESE